MSSVDKLIGLVEGMSSPEKSRLIMTIEGIFDEWEIETDYFVVDIFEDYNKDELNKPLSDIDIYNDDLADIIEEIRSWNESSVEEELDQNSELAELILFIIESGY